MASGGGSYTFKIVLLGEGCVGKTSCVLRYVEDRFNDKHITTLQVWKEFLMARNHMYNYETLAFLHDFIVIKENWFCNWSFVIISNSKMTKEIMWNVHRIIQSHAAQCGKNENSLSLEKFRESTWCTNFCVIICIYPKFNAHRVEKCEILSH